MTHAPVTLNLPLLLCSAVAGTWFCAFCLSQCGKGQPGFRASHEHVRSCAFNNTLAKGVFAGDGEDPLALYDAARRLRRGRELALQLAQQPPDVRTAFLSDPEVEAAIGTGKEIELHPGGVYGQVIDYARAEVLPLRCPQCRKPHPEAEEGEVAAAAPGRGKGGAKAEQRCILAVKCEDREFRGCGACFCAACLESFGDGRAGDEAAMAHARVCPAAQGLGGSPDAAPDANGMLPRSAFARAQRRRRGRLLAAFLEKAQPDVRSAVEEALGGAAAMASMEVASAAAGGAGASGSAAGSSAL